MIITLKDGLKTYGEGENRVYALNYANLSLEEGEICVVLGPSGSGKTTMLNMLGGLDGLDSGSLIVGGVEISGCNARELTEYRRSQIGFVFQFYNLIPDLTVEENIEVVRDISKNPLDIDEILKALDIDKYRYRFPKELSGGQQQRVAIARALIKNPKLLLCDELTGALDSKSARNVLMFVQKINKQFGTTIIIITHNEGIVPMANRVVRIMDGKVMANEINNHVLMVEEM